MMQNPQYYFGLPGDLIALPRPTRGMPTTPRRGRTAHSLIGGGTATTVRARTRSGWTLAWPWLDEATAQAVLDYTKGIFGEGPFRYIDPMWRNVLPAGASVVGRISGDPKIGSGPSWRPGGGDLLVLDPAATVGPNRTSGIMRWTGAVSGDFLILGSRNEALSTGAAIFDEPNEIPIAPGESVTFSYYARLASGTSASVTARLHGLTAAGGAGTSAAGTAVVLSASWQRVVLTAAQFNLGSTAVYARPVVGCSAASGSPVIQIAAPQVEYGPAATDWLSGSGSPRVLIVDDPEITMEQQGYRTPKLVIREA